jgi:hypothetical protein
LSIFSTAPARRVGKESSSSQSSLRVPDWMRFTAFSAAVALVAIVVLRPGWSHWRRSFLGDLGDPSLFVATWRWQAHAILSGSLQDFWRGWFFYPNRWTMGYTEHILGWMPTYVVVEWLSGSAPLAYNFVVIAIFVVNAWAGYLLGKRFGGTFGAGVIAGFVFAFASYRFTQLTHIHTSSYFVVAVALLALEQMLHRPKVARGLAAGLAWGAAVLFSYYHWALITFVVPFFVLSWLATGARWRSAGRRHALAGLVAVVTMLAVVVPLSVQLVLARSEIDTYRRPQEAAAYSVRLIDFFKPPAASLLYERIDKAHRKNPNGETNVFLGLSGFSFLLAGFVPAAFERTRRRRAGESQKHLEAAREESQNHGDSGLSSTSFGAVTPWVVATLAALAIAMGPDLRLGTRGPSLAGPYRLFAALPGFGQIRAVGRFGILLFVLATIASALAWRRVCEMANPRLRKWAMVGLVLLCVLWIAESVTRTGFAPSVPANRSEAPEYSRWLSEHADGAVAELPIYGRGTPWDSFAEARRLYISTFDWVPRVNGYSGYEPRGYSETVRALESFPSEKAVERLAELGVRYLVVHYDEAVVYRSGDSRAAFEVSLTDHSEVATDKVRAELASAPRLVLLAEWESVGIYKIVTGADLPAQKD